MSGVLEASMNDTIEVAQKELTELEAAIEKKYVEIYELACKVQALTWKHKIQSKFKDDSPRIHYDIGHTLYAGWSESSEGC